MMDSRKSLFHGGVQSEPLDMSSPAKTSGVEPAIFGSFLNLPSEQDIPEPVLDATQQLEPGAPAQQHEDVHQVAFLPGTVDNVEFLVLSANTYLDEKSIRNYYFLAAGTTPWCLRASLGKAQFFKKTHRELNMFPTEEYELDFQEHAMDLVDKEKNRLKLLKETITKGKPYGKYQSDVRFIAEEKRKFMEMFEGEKIPAADVAIPKYMASEITKNFYKKLEEKASNGDLVTGKELVYLGKELIKRYVYHYN